MSFSKRKTATIDHTKCGSVDSSNFTVLLSMADNDFRTVANGGYVQSASGFDIRPYADSGLTTPLSFQLTFYHAPTGIFTMWVKLPTLLAATDTVFYFGFGDASITTDGSSTAAWDSSYAAIYHLGDGATVDVSDATGNANHGTNSGVTAQAGQIYGAGRWDGANAVITVPDAASLDLTTLTISLWAQYGGGGQPYVFDICKKGGASDYTEVDGYMFYGNAVGNIVHVMGPGNGTDNASYKQWTMSFDTVWHKWDAVINGSTYQLFKDGVEVTSGASIPGLALAAPTAGTRPLLLGARTFTGELSVYGLMDEIRLSNVARSASWLVAEYNNQYSPTSFTTLGAAEDVSGGTTATIAATQSADLVSILAANWTTAAIAAIQEPDLVSISVLATTSAEIAATQAPDFASVTADSWTTASIAATQTPDIAALVAQDVVQAAIAAAQAPDLASISALATTSAAIAATQAPDLVSVTGDSDLGIVEAVITVAQQADLVSLLATATTGAEISATQAPDSVAVTADSDLGIAPAAIAATQQPDVVSVSATAVTGAEIVAVQAPDVVSVMTAAVTAADILAVQAPDAIMVTAGAPILGASIFASQAPDLVCLVVKARGLAPSLPLFDVSVLWPAFAEAGMLEEALLLSRPGVCPPSVMVGFVMPDMRLFGSMQSAMYEIEYQTADLGDLEQDEELEIKGVRYRVREPSFVVENAYQANDGTYRRALLTRI